MMRPIFTGAAGSRGHRSKTGVETPSIVSKRGSGSRSTAVGPSTQRITATTVVDPTQVRAAIRAVRTQGYAVLDQELELGLRSLAVPIRDANGGIIAAANVSTSVLGADGTAIEQFLEPLQATAAAIEADLRAQGR